MSILKPKERSYPGRSPRFLVDGKLSDDWLHEKLLGESATDRDFFNTWTGGEKPVSPLTLSEITQFVGHAGPQHASAYTSIQTINHLNVKNDGVGIKQQLNMLACNLLMETEMNKDELREKLYKVFEKHFRVGRGTDCYQEDMTVYFGCEYPCYFTLSNHSEVLAAFGYGVNLSLTKL